MTIAPSTADEMPYTALAEVYDRWTAQNDFEAWGADIMRRLGEAGVSSGDQVLELCCGTGLVAEALSDRGLQVTGIDRSAEMLQVARRRLGDDVRLVHADLSQAVALPGGGDYAAAVCTFDSLNYFVDDGQLDALLAVVADALRPGGVFIFDVNSRTKLEQVFGNSHYGDDLGDFAYVWRNRTDPGSRQTHFLITLFQDRGDCFSRRTEHHVQRWFEHEEIRAAGQRHGLYVESVTADYTDAPVQADTLREVWTMRADSHDDKGNHR